jgi:hypothetical protein
LAVSQEVESRESFAALLQEILDLLFQPTEVLDQLLEDFNAHLDLEVILSLRALEAAPHDSLELCSQVQELCSLLVNLSVVTIADTLSISFEDLSEL